MSMALRRTCCLGHGPREIPSRESATAPTAGSQGRSWAGSIPCPSPNHRRCAHALPAPKRSRVHSMLLQSGSSARSGWYRVAAPPRCRGWRLCRNCAVTRSEGSRRGQNAAPVFRCRCRRASEELGSRGTREGACKPLSASSAGSNPAPPLEIIRILMGGAAEIECEHPEESVDQES